MKKLGVLFLTIMAASAVLLVSCASTDGETPDEEAISRGIDAWNDKEPSAAAAYWADIEDKNVNKKFQNYITVYNAGADALASSDSIKASNEPKLLAACNNAMNKFLSLDPRLQLPPDICDKGSTLAAGRISNLLAAENLSAAKKMYASANKLYGESDALTAAGKELDMCSSIINKKAALNNDAAKARATENFDDKIAGYDATLAAFTSSENKIASAVAGSDVSSADSVKANVRSFKKAHQDLAVERSAAIRAQAYQYKDRIGEEFASSPDEGKNGKMSLEDILAHYQDVKKNIDVIYQQLLDFAAKYPKDVGKDVIDDISSQRTDLEDKIAQVNKEIATAKEIASRGKVVMPVMIGLFNPAPGSSAESKKSRPAKFSATDVKKDEYWWGMVSIPKGQMNDLVITLKDNRTVQVFNENTKSGKLIKKNNLKNLVNIANKVGNSWPVLNAGKQLTTDKYFFQIQKGKTDSYDGEVVVYSSFVVRMR